MTNVTLKFERGTAFVSELVDARCLVVRLAAYTHDAAHRRELGHLAAELDGLWAMTRRTVSQAATGNMGPQAMMMKVAYSETRQKLGELSLAVLGRLGLSIEDFGDAGNGIFVEERLRTLALTIAAGTTQIQKNIISERILGMPKGN